MQPALRNFRLEKLPDDSRNILASRNLARQLRHFIVQMAMVHAPHDFLFENLFQFFQIQHHAGDGIGLALDGYLQRVIMTMAMGIVALTKNTAVLLGRKIRVVVEMRSRKLDFAREENHDGLIILSIRESQRHSAGPSIRFFPLRRYERTAIAQRES